MIQKERMINMENIDERFKKIIYELMNGSWDLETYPLFESGLVENEFADGMFCDKAYETVSLANCRLCERLGVQEDADIETIISTLLRIGKHMAMKMYDYGVVFSLPSIK